MPWGPPKTPEEKALFKKKVAEAKAQEALTGPKKTSPKWLRFRLAKLIEDPVTPEKTVNLCIQALTKLEDRDRTIKLLKAEQKILRFQAQNRLKAERGQEPKAAKVTEGLAGRISQFDGAKTETDRKQ
jgi:hypothetical protein